MTVEGVSVAGSKRDRTVADSSERCRHLLAPGSVAVIGASPRKGTLHGRIVGNLLDCGFEGDVYPVNPRYEEVSGLTSYASVEAIGAPVDLAMILVGASRVIDAVDDCIRAGVRAVLIFASGFAEAGDEGARIQAELAARTDRIVIGGPNVNCVLSKPASAGLGFGPTLEFDLREAPSAVISQSGAVGTSIVTRAAERGLGFRYVIATGNEVDLGVEDYLAFLSGEPEPVESALIFVETIRDVPRFVAAARACRERGIRIIALKVGRSQRARAVSATHTAAMAGPIELYNALFEKLGIWSVDTLDQLALASQLRWWDDRVDGGLAALSFSGGSAALLADGAEEAGVELVELTEATRERLREATGASDVQHPFDCGAQVVGDVARWDAVLDAMVAQEDAHGLVAVLSAVAGGADEPLTAGLIRHAERGRNVALVWPSGTAEVSTVPGLAAHRVPVFDRIEDAAYCLALRRTRLAHGPAGDAELDAYLRGTAAGGEPATDESLSATLRDAGLRIPGSRLCGSAAEAVAAFEELGGTVVLKVATLLHKSDVGGVVLGLDTVAAVRAAAAELGAAHGFPLELQQQVSGTREVLLGISRSELGVAVVVGAGGVLAELVRDSATLLAPFTAEDAARAVGRLSIGRLLDGFRGLAPADLGVIAGAAVALGRFGLEHPEVESVDLNPIIVTDDGLASWAVDRKLVLTTGATHG